MHQFRAIIADDEELLRSHLRKVLAAGWPELTICAEAANGVEARELMHTQLPDIAFLDIRMPGLTGLEVASAAPEHCLIVFITAYDQYAIAAFENAAIDYILKPLTPERLQKAIVRLKKRLSEEAAASRLPMTTITNLIAEIAGKIAPGFLEWIKVQQGEGIQLIPVDEVSFFRANDKYTEVVTASSDHLIRTSIKQLSLQLDQKKFWQIHRKTIINISKINKVERGISGRFIITFTNRPETLTVSRTYSHLFKQM